MQKKRTLQKISAYFLQEEAKKKGYRVEFVHEDKNVFFIKNKKKEILFKGIEGGLTSKRARYISVDKHLTHLLLQRHHIDFPECIVMKKGEKIDFKKIKKIGYPLVTKPLDGSIGKGVVINIKNKQSLQKALRYSAKFGDDIIIQKFVKGKNLRILVINHKVFAGLEWTRHHIVGDGKSTINELLKKENLNPRRGEDIFTFTLPKIIINKDLEDFFKAQYGYTFTHRLKKNEKIFLKGNGYSKVIDITDIIPKEIKKTCEEVSKIFDLKFAGVDVIYDASSKKRNYWVLEVNSQPGIRTHHLPMEGKSRNVAGAILDLYFNK